MSRTRSRQRDAFTLVEAMLAAVILAMTVSAMVMPFAAGATDDLASERGAVAITLAQDLMEEVLSKPFSDPDDGSRTPGPESDETRGDKSTFDNIDDYDGYTEPPGGIIPYHASADLDPLAATLSRTVSVSYVYVAGQDTNKPPTFARVTVSVYNGPVLLVTLTRLVYAND